VLIRGENGAGKTTFLKALLGLLPVSSGSIDVEHRRVGSPAWRAQRHRVAYVRQSEETGNLPISAVEVAELGARAHSRGGVRRRAKEALHRAHAEHLERRLYTELSGGERQRVSIARALAQEPSVLLLDEPTVGLDVDARRSLLELLHGLAQRQAVTVIVVSHDLAPDDLPLARPLTLADGILLEDARA
jgi:ABC-type Mn2+/Zn2+ transport system ATPase subunit